MDTKLTAKSEVYPSIEELMPSSLLSRIPVVLANEVAIRYDTLGGKYLTDQHTDDGRQINACMFNDSCQDAIEEVVDAVFNVLVWIYKGSLKNKIDDDAYTCLMGLLEIFSLLYTARGRNAVNPT